MNIGTSRAACSASGMARTLRVGSRCPRSTTLISTLAVPGVSEGALFHHFPRKSALLEGCAEHCAESVAAGIRSWSEAPGPPDFRLMFAALFAWAREHPVMVRMLAVGPEGEAVIELTGEELDTSGEEIDLGGATGYLSDEGIRWAVGDGQATVSVSSEALSEEALIDLATAVAQSYR